jgi:hypothetical protein
MKINDDHLYHGAALTQIAEHPQFTAINSFKLQNGASRSAFKINDEIGVFLKYATVTKAPFKEYVFTFRQEHLDEIAEIATKTQKVFLALVCVKGREICCLPYKRLLELIQRRKKDRGYPEDQYTILVTMPEGKSFRVYVNAPDRKKVILGKEIVISRNNFPNKIFG